MTVEEAYREVLRAAAGLDRIPLRGKRSIYRHEDDLEPWRAYLRAYYRWIDLVRAEILEEAA